MDNKSDKSIKNQINNVTKVKSFSKPIIDEHTAKLLKNKIAKVQKKYIYNYSGDGWNLRFLTVDKL